MTCHEARGLFTSLIAGKLAITEAAPVEAHLEQCPECRKMVDDLYYAAPRDPGGRIVLSADMSARRSRLLIPILVVLALGATTIVATTIVVIPGLSSFAWHRAVALVAAVRDAAHSARIASVPATSNRIERPVEPRPTGAPDVGASAVPAAAPAIAPATPAIPSDDRMPSSTTAPAATDSAATSPDREQKQAPPAAPGPTPQAARRPKTSKPVAASPKVEQARARQVELPARAAPEPEIPHAISPVKASESDVVVQLAVRDRGAAERDVNTLLSRLGGTNLGQAEGAAIVAVMPQSSYSEFTRGLAQIGAWNLEASRSSLPDPVRVAVRLAK